MKRATLENLGLAAKQAGRFRNRIGDGLALNDAPAATRALELATHDLERSLRGNLGGFALDGLATRLHDVANGGITGLGQALLRPDDDGELVLARTSKPSSASPETAAPESRLPQGL